MLFFLGKITDLNGLSDLHMAGIRLHQTGDDLQKRRLPASVRSDDPKALVLQNDITVVFQDLFLPVAFADVMEFNGLLPHPGLHRSQFHGLVLHRGFAVLQCFQTFQPCPLLRRPCPASPFRPLQFHPEHALSLALGSKLHLLPGRFQLQESGIIRVISVHFPVADLQDPVRHPVQEITVVGHHNKRPPVGAQILFQPGDHLPVQMVRRLIEKKHIKIFRQRLRQHHPALLAAGEMTDLLIEPGDPQLP